MLVFHWSLILCLQASPVEPLNASDSMESMPPKLEVILEEGSKLLIGVQEGLEDSEWPYEGVYRVRAQESDPVELVKRRSAIPIGYRVGGTSICAQAIFQAPGFKNQELAVEAIRKAVGFVCSMTTDPRMSPTAYSGGYDVRGWGYIYALRMLLALRAESCVPEGMEQVVDDVIRWSIAALDTIEIPQVGGWNYARRGAADEASPTSPFMTAPALIALYEARAQGFTVEESMVERALAGLKLCVAPDGYVAYSARRPTQDDPGQIPGAIGRMVSAESALLLGGVGASERVRLAVDAFLRDWRALEARRRKTGTHTPPYGVAPYYFFYGFAAAADAIELLPSEERGPLRTRLADILMEIREPDGSWNDRIFERSRAFGTAMTMHALQAPWLPPASQWVPAPESATELATPASPLNEPTVEPAPDLPESSP
ncbi:MAG: hypothetical protein CBC35_05690 [Planctomycetes bacterium TMED75]|nr:hypothetical protein [Planctomycetaceae bacterium]OUU93423.1 MAG: hypothetical protein CBC35_05690 [Planctomycetes bacterium TMED75]